MATILVLLAALGAAFAAFEYATHRVILDSARGHLAARSREVVGSIYRFQNERLLTVGSWAEAAAIHRSLASGDPRPAEEYLERTVQHHGTIFSAAALVDPAGRIVAAARPGLASAGRGDALTAIRGVAAPMDPALVALRSQRPAVVVAPAGPLAAGEGAQLLVAAPVTDPSQRAVGAILATIPVESLSRVLAEIDGGERQYLPVVTDGARQVTLSLPAVGPSILEAKFPDGPDVLETRRLAGETFLVVGAERSDDAPNWTAMMLVPERLAIGPLARVRGFVLVAFGLVLAGASGAAAAGLRLVARPLRELGASIDRVSAGDLTARVPETHKDELGRLARRFNEMVAEVARSRDELQRAEALRREMEIAHRIQTAILPAPPALEGFDIAARMQPAEAVGGDLYDVLTFPDCFWLVIGDVSGHGLHAGLVMMIAQAAAHAAIAEDPARAPGTVVAAVNRVLYENVRTRMGRDDYVTLMVARHHGAGRFRAAGAHQPIFIARARGGVDVLDAPGPWCGIQGEVSAQLVEHEFVLDPGDLLFLLTDGLLEATNAAADAFGEERLAATLGGTCSASAARVVDDVFLAVEAFAPERADDRTAVALKRNGVAHA